MSAKQAIGSGVTVLSLLLSIVGLGSLAKAEDPEWMKYYPHSLPALGLAQPDHEQRITTVSEAAKKELVILQGRWKFTGGGGFMGTCSLLQGHTDAGTNFDHYQLIVNGSEFQFGNGAPAGRTTAMIDPTKNPKLIDFKDPTGRLWVGIYRLDGENLVITVGYGNRRPRLFEDPQSELHGDATYHFTRAAEGNSNPIAIQNKRDREMIATSQGPSSPFVPQSVPNVARVIPSNATDGGNTSEAARKELALLQGGWKYNQGGSSGHSADEIGAIFEGGKNYESLNRSDRADFFAEWRLTVNGNEFQFGNGSPAGRTTATIDPTKNPKWIDFKDSHGRSWTGVYRLEGEMLFITVGYGSRPRMVFDPYSYSAHQFERGEAYVCFARPDGNQIPNAVSEKIKKEQDAAQTAYLKSVNDQVNPQSYAIARDPRTISRENLSDALRAIRAYRKATRQFAGQPSTAPQYQANASPSQDSVAYFPPSVPSEGLVTPNQQTKIDNTSEAAKKELALLQGSWRYTGSGGFPRTHALLVGQKNTIQLDQNGFIKPSNWDEYRLFVNGSEFQFADGAPAGRTTVTIDPTKNPMWIDIKDPQGRSWAGVYRLQGERLIMTVGYGNRRPGTVFDLDSVEHSLGTAHLDRGEAHISFARPEGNQTPKVVSEKLNELRTKMESDALKLSAANKTDREPVPTASVPVEAPAEGFFKWMDGVDYEYLTDEDKVDYYAAIAYSPLTGRYGSYSEARARITALRGSRDGCGAADARPVVLVGNGWCALAVGRDTSAWGVGYASDRTTAERYALEAARERTTDCRIAVSVFARN